MQNAHSGGGGDPVIDTDADRHPTFVQAIRRILQEAVIEDVPIEKLEVNVLPSGEVTYRYWHARAIEPEGGVLPPA